MSIDKKILFGLNGDFRPVYLHPYRKMRVSKMPVYATIKNRAEILLI